MLQTRPRRGGRPNIGLVVALTIVVGACGGDDDDGDRSADVVMELVAFEPDELRVQAGTTVSWEQRDAGSHTVTSGRVEQGAAGVTQQPDGSFDSGELATGESFEHTFDEPGTFPYFCSLHPATMRGEIRVT